MSFGRKRGAQPENKNARKHGFYEDALIGGQRKILRRALDLDPHELEQEIALLRARMHKLVAVSPDNLTVLVLAGRLLVKMVATHYGLNLAQETGIHESLKDLIETLAPKAG